MKYTDPQIVSIGCIVCRRNGIWTPASIHHVRKIRTSKVRNKAPRLPICPIHHQWGGYGVALHAGEKKFEENFGSIDGMLDEVEQILALKFKK